MLINQETYRIMTAQMCTNNIYAHMIRFRKSSIDLDILFFFNMNLFLVTKPNTMLRMYHMF